MDYIFGHTSSLASCACEARIDPQAAHGHIFEFISDHAALSAQVSANAHAQTLACGVARSTHRHAHVLASRLCCALLAHTVAHPVPSRAAGWVRRFRCESVAPPTADVAALSALRARMGAWCLQPAPASFFELPSWAGQTRAEQRTVLVAA